MDKVKDLMVPRLGKLLPVGETFITVTKRMTKNRTPSWSNEAENYVPTYEVLRPGDIKTFEKGKRKYVCKVIWLVELKTGLYNWLHSSSTSGDVEIFEYTNRVRYWQFSYLVKVLEN